MLKYNIILIQRSIKPGLVTPELSARADVFFKNGQAMVDKRFIDLIPKSRDSFTGKNKPGMSGVLYLSDKNIKNYAKLSYFIDSASIPASISKELLKLKLLVADDVQIMLEVINDAYGPNPALIIEDT